MLIIKEGYFQEKEDEKLTYKIVKDIEEYKILVKKNNIINYYTKDFYDQYGDSLNNCNGCFNCTNCNACFNCTELEDEAYMTYNKNTYEEFIMNCNLSNLSESYEVGKDFNYIEFLHNIDNRTEESKTRSFKEDFEWNKNSKLLYFNPKTDLSLYKLIRVDISAVITFKYLLPKIIWGEIEDTKKASFFTKEREEEFEERLSKQFYYEDERELSYDFTQGIKIPFCIIGKHYENVTITKCDLDINLVFKSIRINYRI